jgi:membrane protein involved in colicin uptake
MKYLIKGRDVILFITALLSLSGCMSKGIEMTEQQQRMARCDQYVGMSREDCQRGENVTIEDYKDEYKEFERDVNDKMKAETAKAQKAAEADEKMKAEKLKEAMARAKANADAAKKAQIEKQIEALKDN